MSTAELRIAYTPRPGSKPQAELNALEAIYRRAIERHDELTEGGPAIAAPDDAKEIKSVRANDIILERS